MIRIANPGSDISSFIRIYNDLYEALGNREYFGLDDISMTLVERNLAASSGYMGQRALELSTRTDRSRDPLYNQSKMYTELYKLLGWLHPTPTSALTFQFTFLGAHVIEVKRTPVNFFRECLLGLVFPNAILKISGYFALRPFAAILRTMAELEGFICRDEMIIGPLSLVSDRENITFLTMLNNLKLIRGDWAKLQQGLAEMSLRRKITKQTRENYTRFPIAALKWTGWVREERRKDVYGRSIPFLVLTSDGHDTLKNIKLCIDVRASDISDANEQEKAAISRLGFYQMIGRAGLDLNPVSNQMNQDLKIAEDYLGKPNPTIIFSPFQELEPLFTKLLFSAATSTGIVDQTSNQFLNSQVLPATTSVIGATPSILLSISTTTPADENENEIGFLIKSAFSKTKSVSGAVEQITIQLATANKDRFYPFVASLFRTIGYDSQTSRPGVNYERWDALINHPTDSIPIEIKSPGEELFISTKAVRQALENKIILLARQAFPTRLETTSLVVGYHFPNDRSEVNILIDNIYQAFNLVIGVIDIRSLLWLAASEILENKKHNPNDLANLRGFINVSDL